MDEPLFAKQQRTVRLGQVETEAIPRYAQNSSILPFMQVMRYR